MKKKISKIFGVGLSVVLMVSLLSFAAPMSVSPASAANLSFTTETIPSTTNNVTITGSSINITDIAVGGDGNFLMAGTGNTTTVFYSTDRGDTWKTFSGTTDINLVAVAPDDNDIMVWADTTQSQVYSTTSGGTFTSSLGVPTNCTSISDLAISAGRFGSHRVAVSGYSTNISVGTNGGAEVWEYEIGSAAPSWTQLSTKFGYGGGVTMTASNSTAPAIAYSPNFASDEVLVALTAAYGTSDNLNIEMYSYDASKWNSDGAGFTNYPVALDTTTTLTGINTGSLALSPDYVGSDSSYRVAFVGLDAVTDTGLNGIYLAEDDSITELKVGASITTQSVAYNGSTLVAGRNDATTTYYCLDPLAISPTVSTTSSLKSPSGSTNTTLAWAGDDILAVATGDDMGLSKSSNNGKSWNQVSLIDTEVTTLTGVAVSPDGSRIYLAHDDADSTGDANVWRKDDDGWKRILNVGSKTGLIIRVAPDDTDTIYVADTGATTMYYSSDAGDIRWQQRTATFAVQDLAVEGDGDTAYILRNSDGKVSKSTNGGFTWGTAKDTLLAGGQMIKSLSEGNLIVGSDDGWVSYSSDSGDNWTKIPKIVDSTSTGAVQVTATGLADGDFIYASSVAASDKFYRWEIGESVAWKDISTYASLAGDVTGVKMWDGDIYVMSDDNSDSTISLSTYPALKPTVYWGSTTSTALFDKTPQSFTVSTDANGDDKIWAIDNENEALLSMVNSLRNLQTTAVSPAEGAEVNINSVSGTVDSVSFNWERPVDDVTSYDLDVALDPDFDQQVADSLNKDEAGTPVNYVYTGSNTSETPLLPGTTYYWRVRADAPLKGAYSDVRSFTVTSLEAEAAPPAAPEGPAVLAPVNGAAATAPTPSFSWAPVNGTTEYQFKLADNVALGNPIADVKVKTTGYALTKALEEGKTYYWAVKPLAPIEGSWSSLANFTVKTTPPPPAPPPAAAPPVVIKEVPAPVINIPAPPPAQEIVIPPPPPAPAPITPAYIWAIIIIGAVLVIAVIVLIVRTRRAV